MTEYVGEKTWVRVHWQLCPQGAATSPSFCISVGHGCQHLLGLNLPLRPGFSLREPPYWWVQAVEPLCPCHQQSSAEGDVNPCKWNPSHRSGGDPTATMSLESRVLHCSVQNNGDLGVLV